MIFVENLGNAKNQSNLIELHLIGQENQYFERNLFTLHDRKGTIFDEIKIE